MDPYRHRLLMNSLLSSLTEVDENLPPVAFFSRPSMLATTAATDAILHSLNIIEIDYHLL